MQYSVSTADGTVLYILGNRPDQRLVRVDARGDHREELLSGVLESPAWTSHGERYAFAWENGPGVYRVSPSAWHERAASLRATRGCSLGRHRLGGGGIARIWRGPPRAPRAAALSLGGRDG